MPAIDPAKDRVTGLLISRDPLIVWGWSNPPDLAGPGTSLAPHVGNRRAYFLFSPAWTRERTRAATTAPSVVHTWGTISASTARVSASFSA